MKSKLLNTKPSNRIKCNIFKYYIIALLLSLSGNIAAQINLNTEKEALKAETQLKNMYHDTSKVLFLLKLSESYRTSNIKDNKTIIYNNQALRLSKQIQYNKGIASCDLQFSKIEQDHNHYEKASLFAQKATKEFLQLKEYDQLGESYVMVWSTATLLGKPVELRIETLKKASEAFIQANNKPRSADCLKELGDIYQSNGRTGEALVILKEAETRYKSGKEVKMCGLYDLLGTVYKQLGDYKHAIHYGLMAVKDAEKFGEKGLMLCTIYNRLGETYYAILDVKSSIKCFDKSLSIAIQYNDPQSIYILSCNKAAMLLVLKKYVEAKAFLLKMIKQYPDLVKQDEGAFPSYFFEIYNNLEEKKLAEKYEKELLELFNDPKKGSPIKVKICGLFIRHFIKEKNIEKAAYYTKIYSKMMERNEINKEYASGLFFWKFRIDSLSKNYPSAIKNYQNYKKEIDAISIEETKRQVNQFNIIYQTEKKDKNIQHLKKTEEQQQANLVYATKMRNIIFVILILVIIILVLAIIAFYEKQRSNNLLKKKQEEINLKNNSLQNLVTEKEWLLREIHHRVKNNLHMVVGLLASQTEFIKGKEALQVIADSQHRVQAMSIIHQKLYQTDTLSHINMSDYILELTEYLKSSFNENCTVRFNLKVEQLTFPLSHSIPIGLIINEAVTNAIKYAFPKTTDNTITITLKHTQNNMFLLKIMDNGIGMPEDFDLENSNSLGMRLIDGLSHDIHATLKLYNDNGAVITIAFDMIDNHLQTTIS